jgi:hypothetical protein
MKKAWAIAILAVGMAVWSNPGATETHDASLIQRFAILESFKQEAVLDLRTQLIWERSPLDMEVTWATANSRCALKTVGEQTGWRLPTFIELMTLVEPMLEQPLAAPSLPPGHPFRGIKAKAYWTTDSLSSNPNQAYTVDLLLADVVTHDKARTNSIWCVRERTGPPPDLEKKPAGLI